MVRDHEEVGARIGESCATAFDVLCSCRELNIGEVDYTAPSIPLMHNEVGQAVGEQSEALRSRRGDRNSGPIATGATTNGWEGSSIEALQEGCHLHLQDSPCMLDGALPESSGNR